MLIVSLTFLGGHSINLETKPKLKQDTDYHYEISILTYKESFPKD